MAGKPVSVLVTDAFGDQTPRFFNHNIDSLQLDLQAYVDAMGARLRHANHIEDEYQYDLDNAGMSDVLVYGRLYAGYEEDDTTERFSLKRAEIHFTPKFSVPFLKFDAANAEIGGLFRGQIVAARGFVDPRGFHASKIYTDMRDGPAPPLDTGFRARIAVVAGPYLNDSLETVGALNRRLREEVCPDYTIFFGPFVHETCPLLTGADCQFTAGELTKAVLDTLTEGLRCATIASVDDALALPVMPHPALDLYEGKALVKGDPCFISVGGEMQVLATAYEMSFAILGQFDGTGDRMQEIFTQMVHQCSACPVSDPVVQTQYISSLVPPKTPHLICCPTRIALPDPRKHEASIDGTTIVLVPKYVNKDTVRGFAVVAASDGAIQVEWK